MNHQKDERSEDFSLFPMFKSSSSMASPSTARPARKYVHYVTLLEEEKEIILDSGIDPTAETPRTPKSIPNINVPLYLQQRVALYPLYHLEGRGVIKSSLPTFKTDSSLVSPISATQVNRTGEFESDSWSI